MQRITMRTTLLLALVLGTTGCFPTFPDEGALKNLRTVAIQQEPAVLVLDGSQLPSVTLRALVVDPLDLELENTTHEWTIDLGEDFEDGELIEGLIPEGPYTQELDMDFAALLGGDAPPGGGGGFPPDGNGGRDEITTPEFLPVEYNAGLLPITYFADNGDKRRESIKFLNFLVPDFESIPVPPTVNAPRANQAYAEAVAALGEIGPPGAWNANPNITKITVNEGEQVFEGDQITEHEGVIDIGSVEPGAGVRFDVEIVDDGDAREADVELYWTHGTPGLPVTEEDEDGFGGGLAAGLERDGPGCYEPNEEDPEAQDGEGFGGGADLSETFEPDRAFGWTAPCSIMKGPARLFLIARDDSGGVAWQELRVSVSE